MGKFRRVISNCPPDDGNAPTPKCDLWRIQPKIKYDLKRRFTEPKRRRINPTSSLGSRSPIFSCGNFSADVGASRNVLALHNRGSWPRPCRAPQAETFGILIFHLVGYRLHPFLASTVLLHFIATVKQFIPTTPKSTAQTYQRWQAWKILSRFEALNVACACAYFFSELLLRQ